MRKILIGVLVVLLVFVMIGAFGACNKNGTDRNEGSSYSLQADNAKGSTVQKVILTSDRMIVYTVDLALTVDDYPTAAASVRNALSEAEGYEQDTYTSNEGVYRFTLRVPTVNLNSFLEKIGKTGTVKEQTVSGEDITDRYLNAEQERNALLAKKAAFEELATQATTFDEQLKIQDKILEVAAEIDRYNDRLSSYKKASDYSTVKVTFYEEGTYEKPGFWERLGEIFFGSAKSVGTVFGFILTVIIAVIPYALILGAIFGIYVLIRLIVCRVKKVPFSLRSPRKPKNFTPPSYYKGAPAEPIGEKTEDPDPEKKN